MAGVLYIVATPIGNLEDITLRALRTLKAVDLIAAEDTRETRKLLSHYGIATPLTSYYDAVEASRTPHLIGQLKAGKDIALVSDSGTPGLSDPGYRLIRAAVREGIRVVPVPGPSALTAVLSASGIPVDRFVFEGFLPAKRGERRRRLERVRDESRALVFFEAPHRIRESLKDMLEILGERDVVLGRELTKAHEEFVRGRLSEVCAGADEREWRGEITVVVEGSKGKPSPSEAVLRDEIQKLRKEGMRIKEIAQLLGERFSCSKREIYLLALKAQRDR